MQGLPGRRPVLSCLGPRGLERRERVLLEDAITVPASVVWHDDVTRAEIDAFRGQGVGRGDATADVSWLRMRTDRRREAACPAESTR
jgi:hypothetical protein